MQLSVWPVLAAAVLIIGTAAAAQEKLTIRGLESAEVFEAQFNPSELTIDKSLPWKTHKSSAPDAPTLEFTAAEPRTLQAELLFDTFEIGASVDDAFIAPLRQLATVDPAKKRPPLVQVEWGAFPPFRGVIESVGVKYTLFLSDGTPVRAIANITVKEATHVRVKKGPGASVVLCQTPSECPPGQTCHHGACAP